MTTCHCLQLLVQVAEQLLIRCHILLIQQEFSQLMVMATAGIQVIIQKLVHTQSLLLLLKMDVGKL